MDFDADGNTPPSDPDADSYRDANCDANPHLDANAVEDAGEYAVRDRFQHRPGNPDPNCAAEWSGLTNPDGNPRPDAHGNADVHSVANPD